jgi:hypothetical protein
VRSPIEADLQAAATRTPLTPAAAAAPIGAERRSALVPQIDVVNNDGSIVIDERES